jgi:hypothetical protein
VFSLCLSRFDPPPLSLKLRPKLWIGELLGEKAVMEARIRHALTLRRGGTASRRDKCGERARPDWSPQALVESVILVREGVALLG